MIPKNSLQKLLELTSKTRDFDESDIQDMECVFQNSPLEAQYIVNHLQDSTYFPNSQDYRLAIFVGDPGSGKTTMARAIAYTMVKDGWEYRFLPSTAFLGEYRNQTAIRLRKELQAIEASNKPTILIIDELNRLLENADSKHHDTDATSTALWTFIDKQKGNEKFFCIGTMNRINKLPKPFKDRVLLDYIFFPLITDSKLQASILRRHLNGKNSCVAEDVTDEFMDQELKKMGPCAGRNLKKIAGAICRVSKVHTQCNDIQNTPAIVITKESIVYIMNEYTKRKAYIQYDGKDETDEERQSRYHNENINLQKSFHENNQRMQEQHFIQQQKIQAYYNHPLTSEEKKVRDSYYSYEQNKILYEMMENRRIKEAEDKAKADEEAKKRASCNTSKSWRHFF